MDIVTTVLYKDKMKIMIKTNTLIVVFTICFIVNKR